MERQVVFEEVLGGEAPALWKKQGRVGDRMKGDVL